MFNKSNTKKLIHVLEQENKKLLEERESILHRLKDLEDQAGDHQLSVQQRLRSDAITFVAVHTRRDFDIDATITGAQKMVDFILGGILPNATVVTLRGVNAHKGNARQ